MNHILTVVLMSAALLASACSGPVEPGAHDGYGDAGVSGTTDPPAHGVTAMHEPTEGSPDAADPAQGAPGRTELATFGAGCFWCVEAVLERLDGVLDVTSGYMGGTIEDPTYEQVCGGWTGHAEVVQVTFDPSVIGYDDLLAWFWQLHDPTTLNRQGADVGTQYRSAIFVHSDAQRRTAEAARTGAEPRFPDPIVTEIVPATIFYAAGADHQDFYRANGQQRYCRLVIAPKLEDLGLGR